MNAHHSELLAPNRPIRVMVVEPGADPAQGWSACEIGTNLKFNTDRLRSFFFKKWDSTVHDALLVAAAAEFCDMRASRLAHGWARDIQLHIPVHEPERWTAPEVLNPLHDALGLLTGDRWAISFSKRQSPETRHGQAPLELETAAKAVMPFSDGLDSCCVAEIEGRVLGDALVRVRVGTHADRKAKRRSREAFTSVPYLVTGTRKESSMRSRGFKFGVVSGLAAYLADAPAVIMPESGQGALGPSLAVLGQIYPDYRTHPMFLRKLERFLSALLNRPIIYELPRLWKTKGETLEEHVRDCTRDTAGWLTTRSCWQQNRHAGDAGSRRQCGICAACLLRRMSVHAANLAEPVNTYVWENLSSDTFAGGASPGFDRNKITGKMRQYAIAGTLHLDHLAAFRSSRTSQKELDLHVFQLSRACGLSQDLAREKLERLLAVHEAEWRAFLVSLGPNSFLLRWARFQ
jgi:hypothetical protein